MKLWLTRSMKAKRGILIGVHIENDVASMQHLLKPSYSLDTKENAKDNKDIKLSSFSTMLLEGFLLATFD